jgi:hypothetical protein
MMKSLFAGVVTVLLLIGTVVAASAATVNVDFGTATSNIYEGQGAAVDSGTNWNKVGIADIGIAELLDSNGGWTGIKVETNAVGAYSDGGGGKKDLLGDRIFDSMPFPWNAFTVDITGLNDAATYNLWFYGSNSNYASKYIVGTDSDYALGLPFVGQNWEHHNNYAVLYGLQSNSSGVISFQVDKYQGSGAAVIGGFQLQSVPIPAAVWLLGSGFLGLIGFRRKRNA